MDSKDAFWMNHKGSPFPQVAEKIEEELEDYRSKEEDIKKMKSDMGLEGGNENDAALGLLSDNTQVKKLTKIMKNAWDIFGDFRTFWGKTYFSPATIVFNEKSFFNFLKIYLIFVRKMIFFFLFFLQF